MHFVSVISKLSIPRCVGRLATQHYSIICTALAVDTKLFLNIIQHKLFLQRSTETPVALAKPKSRPRMARPRRRTGLTPFRHSRRRESVLKCGWGKIYLFENTQQGRNSHDVQCETRQSIYSQYLKDEIQQNSILKHHETQAQPTLETEMHSHVTKKCFRIF